MQCCFHLVVFVHTQTFFNFHIKLINTDNLEILLLVTSSATNLEITSFIRNSEGEVIRVNVTS